MDDVKDLQDAERRSSSAGPLWLASASARRRKLLEEAGIEAVVRPSDIDDTWLVHGMVPPRHWVVALAYFKGRRVADALRRASPPADGVVLGADTVCVVDDSILGQPRDETDARRMLLAMRDREHVTMTGVCLIALDTGRRHLLFDQATVRVGAVPDEAIDDYVASGEWRGKAGGYNLSDRQGAGWPITCMGDPTTVMGLPMRRLPRWLDLVGKHS